MILLRHTLLFRSLSLLFLIATLMPSASTAKAEGDGSAALIWKFDVASQILGSDPVVSEDIVYVGTQSGTMYAIESQTGQEEWRFESGMAIQSSATLENGVLYFGTGDRSGTQGNLFALNAASGEPLWQSETGAIWFSSPVLLNGVVFAGSVDGALYALDASTGSQLWRWEGLSPIASELAVTDTSVIAGDVSGNVVALDIDSGQELWTFSASAAISSAPVVDGTSVLVGSHDHYLYSLDVNSGEETWRFEAGAEIEMSPVVIENTVYVSTMDSRVYALDRSSGINAHGYIEVSYARGIASGPNDGLIVGSWGTLQSFDRGSGIQQWRLNVEGRFVSDPAFSGDTIFFASDSGMVYAVDSSNLEGELEFPSENSPQDLQANWSLDLGVRIAYDAVVDDGIALVSSWDNETLYAIDVTSGDQLWASDDFGDVNAKPVIADGIIYLFHDYRYFSAVRAKTGEIIWSFSTDGPEQPVPVISDGIVYYGSYAGSMIALDIATGSLLWESPKTHSYTAPAVVAQDLILIWTRNEVSAVNAKSGELAWTFRPPCLPRLPVVVGEATIIACADSMTAIAIDSGQSFWSLSLVSGEISSPIVSNGENLYVASTDGNVTAINALNGTVVWQFATVNSLSSFFAEQGSSLLQVFSQPDSIGSIIASPDGRTIYLGGLADGMGGHASDVYALDASTGELSWRRFAGRSLFSAQPFNQIDDFLFVALNPGLTVLSASTGDLLWHVNAGGLPAKTASTEDQTLVTLNGVLYSLVNSQVSNRSQSNTERISNGEDGQQPVDDTSASDSTNAVIDSGINGLLLGHPATLDMFGRLPVAVLTLDPGAETPLMMLPGPLEGFVLAGEIELKSDQSTLMSGEKFQVQPGEEFTAQNNGSAPAVVLLVLNYQTFEQFAQITYSLVCTECYPQGVSLLPISAQQDPYSRLQSGNLSIYRIAFDGEVDITPGPTELPSLKSILFVMKGEVAVSPQSVTLSSGENLEFDPDSELLLAAQTDEPAEVIVVRFELD